MTVTIYKLYDENNCPVYLNSIIDLADLCGVSINEARKAYYNNVTILNGFEVITLR